MEHRETDGSDLRKQNGQKSSKFVKKTRGKKQRNISPQQELWFNCVWMRSFFPRNRKPTPFWRTHPVKEITLLLGGRSIISVSFRPPTLLAIHSSWQPNPHPLLNSVRQWSYVVICGMLLFFSFHFCSKINREIWVYTRSFKNLAGETCRFSVVPY